MHASSVPPPPSSPGPPAQAEPGGAALSWGAATQSSAPRQLEQEGGRAGRGPAGTGVRIASHLPPGWMLRRWQQRRPPGSLRKQCGPGRATGKAGAGRGPGKRGSPAPARGRRRPGSATSGAAFQVARSVLVNPRATFPRGCTALLLTRVSVWARDCPRAVSGGLQEGAGCPHSPPQPGASRGRAAFSQLLAQPQQTGLGVLPSPPLPSPASLPEPAGLCLLQPRCAARPGPSAPGAGALILHVARIQLTAARKLCLPFQSRDR